MISEMMNGESAAPDERRVLEDRTVWKGLIWQQWLAHGSLVTSFLTAWIVGVWVLPIFYHPGFVLGFGVIYALVVGTALGASETLDGTEEFTFALPPRRQERYLARLAVGLVPLLLLIIVGLLSIVFQLPQRLWGLFVESGFELGFMPPVPTYLYLLSALVPIAVYAFAFVGAALIATRSLINLSWLMAILLTLIVLSLAFWGEHLLGKDIFFREVNGWLMCPSLLLASGLALRLGYSRYAQKEGISRPSPLGGQGSWPLVLVIGFLLLLILLRPIFGL